MRVSRANLAAIACLTESEWLSFPPPLLARPDAVAENLMTRASEKQQPQTHIKTPNLWRMNKSMPWTRSDRPFRKCFHRVWHYFNQDITYISSYFPRIAVTPFQKRVYSALCEIPKGRVTTYKALAAHLGCGSSQAVGQALRRNPFAPRVPCHRVITTDGSIGGFCGKRAGSTIARKLALLEAEGVHFVDAPRGAGKKLANPGATLWTWDN